MENDRTARLVHVHIGLPAGPGPRPVVLQYRADARRVPRPHTIGHGVVLLVPVVRDHEDVQGTRRELSGTGVEFVRRVLRGRVCLHTDLRAGDQQQERRTDPPRPDRHVHLTTDTGVSSRTFTDGVFFFNDMNTLFGSHFFFLDINSRSPLISVILFPPAHLVWHTSLSDHIVFTAFDICTF